jgi:hypothetical protein
VPRRAQHSRPRVKWRSAGALGCLAILAPLAFGKGVDLSLRADDRSPNVGQQVTINLKAQLDPEITQACDQMRVVVVAPGVSVRRALRSLEGGKQSRRIGHWDAFRLESLRPIGELRWGGRLRPNKAGRWTLVVPNWCGAGGYVLPEGVTRLNLDVTP